ncbi:MAG: CpaD family pilus assembly protein [Novosphingobium sp.]
MILSKFRAGRMLALPLALAGCGGVATNRSLYSVHEPVVERTRASLDLEAGPSGLSDAERGRLAEWLAAMHPGYGDHVTLDDGGGAEGARQDVATLLSAHGLALENGAPSPSDVPPGVLRVVVTRARASVPGCPDWSAKNDSNPNNATSSNFGCAVNGNLAAMVADPEHLLKGADAGGGGRVYSGGKAIAAWRDAPPSGLAGLRHTSTSSVSAGGGN